MTAGQGNVIIHADRYIGMLIDTEKDLQCSRQLDIDYGCYLYDIDTLLLIIEISLNPYIDITPFSVT